MKSAWRAPHRHGATERLAVDSPNRAGWKAAGAGGVGYAVGLRTMASDGAKNDERAGRVAAELKETEDLLAGFDRPGRTPRVPPVQRDFVDYHLDKGQSKPAPRSPGLAADRARRDLPTAIIPAHKRKLPAWVPWAAALAAMSGGGVLVAAMLAGPPNAGSSNATNAGMSTGPVPTVTTTLASGSPAIDPTTGPARDIPPPPPSTAEAIATASPDPDLGPSAVPATRPNPTSPVATTKTAAPNVAPAVTTARGAAPASSNPMPETAPSASSAPSATPSVDLIRHL